VSLGIWIPAGALALSVSGVAGTAIYKAATLEAEVAGFKEYQKHSRAYRNATRTDIRKILEQLKALEGDQRNSKTERDAIRRELLLRLDAILREMRRQRR